MASPRYTLNIKPEDLQPEQPKHEMTGKEKRENFMDMKEHDYL